MGVETRSMTLKAFFDVGGQELRKTHACTFAVDLSAPAATLTLHMGGQEYVDPTEAELTRARPKAVTGQLTGPGAVGAQVEFIDPRRPVGLFGSTPVATCTADAGGRYAAFVPPGVYDVRVHAAGRTTVHRGVAVQRGLRQHWWITAAGLPASSTAEQTTFNDCPWVLIRGQLVLADGEPAADAQVLVTADDQVHAYVSTDADGRYTFALRHGVYTVRLMLPGSPTKVIPNVAVDGVNPWSAQLGAGNINANRAALLVHD